MRKHLKLTSNQKQVEGYGEGAASDPRRKEAYALCKYLGPLIANKVFQTDAEERKRGKSIFVYLVFVCSDVIEKPPYAPIDPGTP